MWRSELANSQKLKLGKKKKRNRAIMKCTIEVMVNAKMDLSFVHLTV